MIKTIVDFFIERKFLVNLVGAFICLIGLVTLFDMKRDLIPPLEFQMVSVSASMPGASTLEMEKLVTFPIEESLKGLPGLVKTTSDTSHGSASIYLQYEPSYKQMQEAVEVVRSRVLALGSRLPDTLLPVQVRQEKVTEVFLSVYALENADPADVRHRESLRALQKRVEKVPGVVRTEAYLNNRDLYIRFDADKLERAGVSAMEIRRRLADSFAYIPVGRLQNNETDLAIELGKPDTSLESISNLPISGNRSGNILRLKDIATVEYGLGEVESASFFNGKDAIYLRVMKDTLSDSIRLHETVDTIVQDFNKQLAEPLKFSLVFDGPHFIRKQIGVLAMNGLGGFLLVIVVLMVFLNVRTAIMTAWGLPISYLGTFAILSLMGIAIDLISIVGMILVIGILVDDAIIVSERYIENLTKGMKPPEAASRAARDLILPVTGTILTTVVAFLPILMVRSELMTILFAVPIVILSSLAISWLESFFILPNHLAHFVKNPPKERSERFFERVRVVYRQSLRHTLRFRYLYVAGLLAFTAFSFYIAGTKVRHDFSLSIGSERLDIFVVLKESASLQETRKKIEPIHAFLQNFDHESIGSLDTDVGSIWRDGRNYKGYRYAKIRIWLDQDHPHPKELKADLLKRIEPELNKVKTDAFEDLSVKEAKQGDDELKRNLVSVRIRGSEQVSFHELENALVASVQNQGLIGEHVKPEERYQDGWEFIPNPSQLIRYGLSQVELGSQIKQIFTPHELTQMRMDGEPVTVYTQLALSRAHEFERLARYEILTPQGTSVPLSLLGEWKTKTALKSIRHQNAQRTLTVDFRFDGEKTNAAAAKADLVERIKPIKDKFPAYEIEAGDANEQDTENQKWALKVGIYCLLGVLFVLSLVLGSITQPFLVAAPIPFGIVGIIWALYLHDLPLGLMAMIGLVGTIGVSVNDSLVMTDHINTLKKKAGRFDRELLVQGASDRLRAIFLTTFTTVVGVFPMAYGIGGESGFTQPLAFSMGWGLSFSTLATLFGLPALLVIREDILSLLARKFGPRRSQVVALPIESAALDFDLDDEAATGTEFDMPRRSRDSDRLQTSRADSQNSIH